MKVITVQQRHFRIYFRTLECLHVCGTCICVCICFCVYVYVELYIPVGMQERIRRSSVEIQCRPQSTCSFYFLIFWHKLSHHTWVHKFAEVSHCKAPGVWLPALVTNVSHHIWLYLRVLSVRLRLSCWWCKTIPFLYWYTAPTQPVNPHHHLHKLCASMPCTLPWYSLNKHQVLLYIQTNASLIWSFWNALKKSEQLERLHVV